MCIRDKFYYHPLTPNAVSRLGNAIHDEPGTAFFERARSVMHTMATPSRRSYLAGFLCHYMLDSRCHPYIDGHPSLSHHLIETELEDVYKRQSLTYQPHSLCGALLLSDGRSNLRVCFTLRCLQRLSSPHIATQLCLSLIHIFRWDHPFDAI